MKVSVITSSFNCEHYIKESIESIVNQTHQDWELVIGDDGSSDRTREIIDSYARKDNRIKCYHSDKNIGLLMMFNKLLSYSTGDFIMTHDADDISEKNRMELQLRIFYDNHEIGACGTNGVLFSDNQEARINNSNDESGIVDKNYAYLPFMPATIMYRRGVYESIGGFHSYFDRLSSMDQYWLFLMSEKYDIYYLNKSLYRARIHATSNHRTVSMTEFKKMASFEIYLLLRRQRQETGTDMLEQNNYTGIEQYVESLKSDKKWLSERYREYAAIRVDVGDIKNAYKLISRAILKNPLSINNYRTLLYALKNTL